ncbi:MAG TPA: flagellin [Phycisphaerales bacterium]|nr:flagellin [Phycisphaerales bacterium]
MISPLSGYSFMIGQRGLRNAQAIVQQAAERLATGKRINRASDDPSGLIAVDEFTARITKVEKKLDALDQEEARLGAMEGSLSVVHDLLHELNGLVVTAANKGGTSPEELEGLQLQADEILKAMDFIGNTAVFKGEKLFEGLFSTSLGRTDATVHGEGDDVKTVEAVLASIKSGGVLNLIDGDLESAQDSVEAALGSIGARRAGIGARITNGIAPERNQLLIELENSEAARSQILDADIAAEMSNLIRGQILEQASISALLIGRQAPQQALQLLSANLALARK